MIIPLYNGLASQNGHLDIVKYLVECGADIIAADKYTRTSKNEHLDVVEYLNK